MSTNMNISNKTNSDNQRNSGKTFKHKQVEKKLDAVSSLLYSRNFRRFRIMTLTAAITGMTVSCTELDATSSNTRFYNDFIRYIELTGDDTLDEIDRQQINLNNIDQAVVSATCVRALSVVAAGCKEEVLRIDEDEIPIEPSKPLLQLNINGQPILSCRMRKSSHEQAGSGSISHESQIRMTPPQRTRKQEKKIERDRKRLKAFLALKNNKDDPFSDGERIPLKETNVEENVYVNVLQVNKTFRESSTQAEEEVQPLLVRLEDGPKLDDIACKIKPGSFKIDVIENDHQRRRPFKSCKTFMCIGVWQSGEIVGKRKKICPCFTPLSTSITRSELGMLKYLVTRLEIVDDLMCGDAIVYDCETSEFKLGISF